MKLMTSLFILVAAAAFITGCNNTGNPLGAGPTSTGISETKDGMRYTFAVAKDTLSILDGLSMTLTALNQTDTPQTVLVSDYFYKWSLCDSQGNSIASGPTVISNLIERETIGPNQSRILYGEGYSMADLFGKPIQTGIYNLTWKLSNGFTFQIPLLCEGQTAGPGINSPVYPLKVGNEWTFLKTYSVNGQIMGTDTVREQIVGEEEIKGEEWFLLKSDDYVDQYITSRQGGIYKYFPDLDTVVILYKSSCYRRRFIQLRVRAWVERQIDNCSASMTVDSTSETLSVPEGKFSCYKYTQPEDTISSPGGSTIIVGQVTYLSTVGPVARGGTGISSVLLSVNFK